MKKIAILGSTGSIGTSLINIIKKDKKILRLNFLQLIKIIKIIKTSKIFNVKNVVIINKIFLIEKKLQKKIKLISKYFNHLIKFLKIKKIDYTMSAISGFAD